MIWRAPSAKAAENCTGRMPERRMWDEGGQAAERPGMENRNGACTVDELKGKRERGEEFLLLDVRTEDELALARIEPCRHIPLHELPARAGELEPWRESEIVVMCHHGVRSMQARDYLAGCGFRNVRNLTGGIDAYSAAADNRVPRYC